MVSRKINAGISLLTTVLLLGHAILNAVRMFSGRSDAAGTDYMAWVLVGLLVAHIFISIDLAVSAHMGTEKRKCNNYPKMNVATIVQRASGVLLVPTTGLHIAGTIGLMQPPKVVHAILPPLFFTIAMVHASIATSKAFITLGIGNAKLVKVIDIVMKVLCGVVLVVDVIGFYLYLV